MAKLKYTRKEHLENLKAVLIADFDERFKCIDLDINFREELEMDSLDEVELNMSIEKALDNYHNLKIDIMDDFLIKFETLNQLLEYYISVVENPDDFC